jgi:hypothetical protein
MPDHLREGAEKLDDAIPGWRERIRHDDGIVTLIITNPYREYRSGSRFIGYHISEDEFNFYVHGYNDEPTPGVFSNYLTVPKYAGQIEIIYQ